MKQQFIEKKFSKASLEIIGQANEIIEEYLEDDLLLTLRQLYYQFVGRGLIENTQASYKRIGSIISDARLAGFVDWAAIEDRTRNLSIVSTWNKPSDIMYAVVDQYRTDKWADQPSYIEVWIEKEALTGVIAQICDKIEVPYFACRGYVSQSEMYSAARRLKHKADQGKQVIVLHLGDHDPSGMDMTRDNLDRLVQLSSDSEINVKRIALNMDQIAEYNPPPNPTKLTDSRSKPYVEEFGSSSWELDALSPRVIRDLIDSHVALYRDDDIWAESEEHQADGQEKLQEALDFLTDSE